MSKRKLHIQIIFLTIIIIYIIVLMDLQLFDTQYQDAAENNILRRIKQMPLRGMIYDRKGKILVRNKPVFQLQIICNQLEIKDTLAFCKLLNINVDFLKERLQKPIKYPARYSKYKPFIFIEQISLERYASIEDQLIKYPGIIVIPSMVRDYPHKSLSNVLGYLKEVDKDFLKRDTTNSYKQGDLIGISGIEKYYEKYLRGKSGVKYVISNVRGIIKGSFNKGKYDTIPQFGDRLIASIDLKLQQYAEMLMQNKKGAIVAIEPKSGEILVMLTSPSYDPNLLTGTGKHIDENYLALVKNPHNPLFNRTIQSLYPPGSTFKTLIALVGLQSKILDTVNTIYYCNQNLVACHSHKTPLNLYGSLQYSCNPYYYQAIKKIILSKQPDDGSKNVGIGLDFFQKEIEKFGMNRKLGIDLPFENQGQIPSSNLYDKIYNKNWQFEYVQSIGIGQGEIVILPIQLANQVAIIANRGWYITPHIIKEIGKSKKKLPQYKKVHSVDIEKSYFDYVARAMRDAVSSGTAPLAFTRDINICGKTGTAQNPHGEDHSVFMAFAPLEEPKIAIAVYVENAGFGGSWAAPIASLIIEKYLKNQINFRRKWLENYVKNKNFLQEEVKDNKPLSLNQ